MSDEPTRAQLNGSITVEAMVREAYDLGYQHGLQAYAWWRDGTEYVGTSGTELRRAVLNRAATFNYDVPATYDLKAGVS